MLYFIRYRLKETMVADLADSVKSGGFPYKAKYVYASLDDPFVGVTIWDVPATETFQSIKAHLERYAVITEIMPVISAEEAQQKIFEKLSHF
jgi:predicted GTPase